jgi:hypothetical protein
MSDLGQPCKVVPQLLGVVMQQVLGESKTTEHK